MSRRKTNLTFRPVPKDKQKLDNDLTKSVVVECVDWKGRPFLQIFEDPDFDPDHPYRSPEVERFFIRTMREDQLRVFYGYATTLQAARDQCEVVAKDFEKFLNDWHNTKQLVRQHMPLSGNRSTNERGSLPPANDKPAN